MPTSNPIVDALRKKYKTPQAALQALGLDAALLTRGKDTSMTPKISRTANAICAALYGRYSPKLAQDKEMPNLKATFKDVRLKNLLAADGTLDTKKLQPLIKLARDALEPALEPAAVGGGAGPDDVILKLLEHVVGGEVAADPSALAEEAAAGDPAATAVGGGNEALMSFLSDCGLDEATLAKVAELLGGGGEPAAGPAEPDARKKPGEDEEDDKVPVTEKAMDAAIASAVTAAEKKMRQSSLDAQEAREFVRPWVGQLPMALDSAEDIHRATLKALGVDPSKMHLDALRPVIQAQPKPGQRPSSPVMATDSGNGSSGAESFYKEFPAAANIRIL